MSEAISKDQFLPGVDWSQYDMPAHVQKLPTLEQRNEAAAGSRRNAQAVSYMGDFPEAFARTGTHNGADYVESTDESRKAAMVAHQAEAKVPLEGLHTNRLAFTPEQESDEVKGKEALRRGMKSRPMEGGIGAPYLAHSFRTDEVTGDRHHIVALQDGYGSGPVGSVRWHGPSGHVEWLGLHPDYRHLTHHLLGYAHKVAEEHGDLGPLASSELSSDSFRIMTRHAKSFIPKKFNVDGEWN